MSSAVVEPQEKEMAEFGSDANIVNPSDYSCQILQEKTTLEAANDKSLPKDARPDWDIVDGGDPIHLPCAQTTVASLEMSVGM